jgi:alcohol dehydrogenase
MRALVLGDDVRFETDYPDPEVRKGETLIRVRLAGICRTDIELVRGYMGFRGVLGHEFVGDVVRTDRESLAGKRVVGEINCPCDVCELCRRGLGSHCSNRTVLGILGRDGAFADHLVLPDGNLHIVPDGVPDEEAVFAEPLAAALEILEQVHLQPGWRVAVLGDGKLGLLVAQVLNRTGCDITLYGHHQENMALVEDVGIRTLNAREDTQQRQRAFKVVVDATGSWEGLELARNLLRPRGLLVLKSTLAAGRDLNLSWLVVDEITLVGSRCGPFAPAIRLLASRGIRTTPLIEARFPVEQWEAAFRRATTPGAKKVLLDMQ